MVKDPSLRFGIQDHCDRMGPMTMSTEGEIEREIVEGQKNDNLPLRGREALFRSKFP